jgi:LuxR family maltose regulon positive regulatory protein
VNHQYADGQVESLTAREIEVLRLIAEGGASRDIATRLGISYTTVRSHIRSIGAKLGVHSKRDAVVKAKRLAIIG